MGGYSSKSNLQTAISLGKTKTFTFLKTSSLGRSSGNTQWFEFFSSTGSPGAISFSGTAGAATALTNSTSGALTPLPEGNVSSEKRYLLGGRVATDDTVLTRGIAILADLLLYYPSVSNSTTETVLDNTVTLPRYTDGVGVMGCQIYGFSSNSNDPTFTFTADDNSSQSGRLNTIVSSAPTSLLTANLNPFIPISGGKQGIKKIDSYVSNISRSGTSTFILLKPLAVFPIVSANTQAERDFIQTFPHFIQIEDGACLGLFVHASDLLDSGPRIFGSMTYGWN